MAPSPDDPDPPWEGYSTAQLAAALGVSRQTVNNWKHRDLLPAPVILHLGARGRGSVWPPYTLPLAEYVKEALQAQKSVAQLAVLVRPLLAQDPAWVEAELASGRTIETILMSLRPKKGKP